MEIHLRLLHAIPDLLLAVAREDDEGRVLQGGCRWAAEQAGAEVGFLDSSRGVVLAAQPPGLPGLGVDERSAVLSRDRLHVLSRSHDVVVSAPVRYAGSIAGHVVAIGASVRAETMAEAVEHLAAFCAPAVRARLELISVREQGATRIPDILGRSPAIVALREAVVRAAVSAFSVVVEGESGSGKELVARAIHRLGARRDRRFAALNCAALTDELAETELFGHTRGAFTGAVGPRAGLFEEAHLGTLFLDEVAELSARTQAKLLRAIQEREVRRLGENASRAVDVRIVAATNRALHRMAAEGLFREDLLFRLAVIRIRVPPLRERPEDIALLAVTVWKQLTRDLPTKAWLGPDALARLAQHSWPGNVRELQNIMAAVAVNAPARGRITARHVTRALEDMGGASEIASASLTDARRVCERRTVVSALARHGGRRSAAARELGLSRQGLAKAIKRLHLEEASVAEGVA
jgi:transcriptional regulator with PAS, ATPase and Fis domain